MYKNNKEMVYFSIHIIFFILAGMIIFGFLSEIINKFYPLEPYPPFVMNFGNFIFLIIKAPIAEEVIFSFLFQKIKCPFSKYYFLCYWSFYY